MPFDFPNTPAEGATYSPANGPQYIFQNGVWKQVLGGQSPVLTASSRNIVINSSFFVSQENSTAVGTASGYYLADQWQLGSSGLGTCSGGSSQQGLKYYGNVYNNAVQGSVAAAAYLMMYQVLEGVELYPLGWGQSHAIPAVLNFKARSNVSGTFSASISDFAGTATYASDFNLVGGEGLKEFTVPISPPAMGSWLLQSTVPSGILRFAHSVGANYKASANRTWEAASKLAGPGITNNALAATNYLLVTDVQLLPDPDNTGLAPKFVAAGWAEDLGRCQRYFQNTGHGGIYLGLVTGVSSIYLNVNIPLMRTAPAVTGIQANPVYNASGTPITPSSPSIVGASNSSLRLTFGHSAPITGVVAQASGLMVNARM